MESSGTAVLAGHLSLFLGEVRALERNDLSLRRCMALFVADTSDGQSNTATAEGWPWLGSDYLP